MSRDKKIICILSGIIAGILLSCMIYSSPSGAVSANEKEAAARLIERYPETHILPSFAMSICYGESGCGRNNGRYYGNMSSRIYDMTASTDQFLDLMLKYGNVAKQTTFIGQLYACQSHGYYGGSSSEYIRYITSVYERHDFEKYDIEAKALEKRLIKQKKRTEKKRKEEKRKRLQKHKMSLIYDPTLAPWQVITYRGVIKGGTIRLHSEQLYGWLWLDVVRTKKGNKPVIYTGNRDAIVHPSAKLEEILEEAVG